MCACVVEKLITLTMLDLDISCFRGLNFSPYFTQNLEVSILQAGDSDEMVNNVNPIQILTHVPCLSGYIE